MNEKTPIVPNKRLQQTQAQVNEVVDIMRVNVDKVLERDQKLSELDGRAGEDFTHAKTKRATRLKYWTTFGKCRQVL
ncbi:Vesicle-associated membrane protein 2 [Paragonimus heterotremus]|uniref:Vesicle-associated membrane protein 2 n=1 Tax=Paragonimus heterotremus TaxID=100268 RepID=A0A8J4T1N4_9TREM|nr:Vesicle-associated membrane protein 2 [Paragonimus heterotremus]